jgi:hypothetical protein
MVAASSDSSSAECQLLTESIISFLARALG